MLESLTDLVAASPWAYLFLLAFAALDPIFPLVPSEAAAVAAGVLAGAGELDITLVVAAAAVGAFSGDNASYSVGRLTRSLLHGRMSGRRFGRAREAVDDRGAYWVIAGRFVPGGRTAVTLAAGVVPMPWPRFARAAAAAALLWATFAAGLGYLGGRTFEEEPWRGLVLAFALGAGVTGAIELWRRLSASHAASRDRRRALASPRTAAAAG
jgi:membrane-associated protein